MKKTVKLKAGKFEATLDGVEERFHVRERDNCVAIVISQPGWAAAMGHDFWYVGIEDLDQNQGRWVHRSGSALSGRAKDTAYKDVARLYEQEASHSKPQAQREIADLVARVATAIQKAGGDHMGPPETVHHDFIELLKLIPPEKLHEEAQRAISRLGVASKV